MSWLAIGIYLAGGLFLFGLSLLERATWQQAIWCIPFFLVPISLAYALTHYGPDIDRFRPVWISIGLILIVILVFVPIRPRRLKTKTYTVTIGGPIHFDHKK